MSDNTTAQTVRTRMAPSPTGDVHIGSLRTALYAYAFAKQNNGQFIVRIEDTDQKRLVAGAADRTLQVFKDYCLFYDEGPDVDGLYGPYVQTQRLDIYKKYINELLDKGLAYRCFCSEERLIEMRQLQKASKKVPKYDRHCFNLTPTEIQQKIDHGEKFVIRLKVPDHETIIFNDSIRGEIKFNSDDVDDQVLIKSNGIPTYHFAVVIDDHLMKVSHVMRGEEWISSTPKQIILYNYFGWEAPKFCHLTVLLDPTHPGKMSKRYGSVFARQFLEDGYLPDAMLNFLMLLGWNPGTNREIFSLDEFVKEFRLKHLHVKQPVFDRKKLDYFNGLYIRQKTDSELVKLLQPFIPQAPDELLLKIIPLIKERIATLKDAANLTKFLFEDVKYDPALLAEKVTIDTTKDMLLKSKELLAKETDWSVGSIQPKLMELIKTNNWKVGDFFMVFRIAVTGSKQTPPIVDCLPILGQENTIRKLNIAISKL